MKALLAALLGAILAGSAAAEEAACNRFYIQDGRSYGLASSMKRFLEIMGSDVDLATYKVTGSDVRLAGALERVATDLRASIRPYTIYDLISCRVCDPDLPGDDKPSGTADEDWSVSGMLRIVRVNAARLLEVNPGSAAIRELSRYVEGENNERFTYDRERPSCADVTEKASLADISGAWVLSDGSRTAAEFQLTETPGRFGMKTSGGDPTSEAFWWYADERIVLVNAKGEARAVLKKVSETRYEGPLVANPAGTVALLRTSAPPPRTGAFDCFEGAMVHTRGANKGKEDPAEICVDWRAPPCMAVRTKINGAALKAELAEVTACTPTRAIEATIDYAGGVTIVWTFKRDAASGAISGTWLRNDGARGTWKHLRTRQDDL